MTVADIKTVHLSPSKKYYRTLKNDTLRTKIKGEERVTAKDIWLDALTCEESWLFTTKNIAARWDIPLKTARQKLTLLSNSGLAQHQKITDPKDGKILMHIWIFYENPLPPKEGHWVFDGTKRNNKRKSQKATAPKKGIMVPIIEKEQQREKTTTTPEAKKSPPEKPPSPPPDVSFVVGLKNRVGEKLRSQFNQNTYRQLKDLKLSDGQIKTLIDAMNINSSVKSVGWLINTARQADEIPDFDEIEKKRLAEEAKTRELSRKAAQKQEETRQQIIDQQQDNLKTMNVIYKLNDNDFNILMRRVMKNMNKFEFKRSHIDDYLAGRTDREFILSITTNQFKIIEAFNGNAIN